MAHAGPLHVQKRIAVLFIASLAASVLLGGRLLYLQVLRAESFMGLALSQRLSPVPLLPHRGTIVDRNGEALAVSISSEAAYAVPVEIADREETAREVAALLDLDVDYVRRQISRSQRTVWLKRQLSADEARSLRQARLPGIYVVEGPERFYPHGRLAAQVIGFSGIDNQGLEGLEVHYDGYLRGQQGMILQERDAAGRAIPGGIERRVAPQNGHTVVLNIDHVIQHIAERELERAVLESQAEFGLFFAVDPRNGEVLASAVYPSYDLNYWTEYDPQLWKNRTVTDNFEPGSTFKVVTGATALEIGAATLESTYVDPVVLTRYAAPIRCWRPGGHGRQTFVEATENSCNPIFAMIAADDIGPDRFHRYISALGFGRPTGIDFPGEAQGSVPSSRAQLLTWANIGFGQGISVTPVQLTMAVAAIANGGTLYRPQLVREILSPEGELIKRFQPEAVRRVFSERTTEEYRQIMRSVVQHGSGTHSDVPGYRVAGKTGTAQIAEGGRYIDLNMASFVGFAPADDPRIAGVIMLYKLHVQPSWGGLWAAPPFGRIVEQALEYMGVPRAFEETEDPGTEFITVPNVRNFDRESAANTLAVRGLRYAFDGAGTYVMDQTPSAGAVVAAGTTVIIHFYEEDGDDAPKQVNVPSVLGRSMRDAAALLHRSGLRIQIEGSGFAVAQEPRPGERTAEGSTVAVRFEPELP